MRTGLYILVTMVTSIAVGALIFAYSTPTEAVAGTVVKHNPGGGNTFTNVQNNYDGKHGEKVTTVTVNGDHVTAGVKTYDANGNQTSCKGAGC
jgi:hypothetical protein